MSAPFEFESTDFLSQILRYLYVQIFAGLDEHLQAVVKVGILLRDLYRLTRIAQPIVVVEQFRGDGDLHLNNSMNLLNLDFWRLNVKNFSLMALWGSTPCRT